LNSQFFLPGLNDHEINRQDIFICLRFLGPHNSLDAVCETEEENRRVARFDSRIDLPALHEFDRPVQIISSIQRCMRL
jgi:hypothetical protein